MCVAVYQATFFVAVADTGVAAGTVVAIGSAPAFAGLLSRTFAGERLDWRWGAATGSPASGYACSCSPALPEELSASGVALAPIAGAGYAGYAVAGKRMLDQGGTPRA